MKPLSFILPLLLLTSTTLAAPKPSEVQAKILTDTTAIKPNTPFTLAIQLTTQPNWHIYWKNPGDGGSPTKFTYHLPEGFKVEPAEFPLPTEFTQPGDITTYGYTGTTIFLATITPPKNLPPDAKTEITVDASWLCCHEECVPGNAHLTLTLPTGDAAATTDKEPIEKAHAQIPATEQPKDVVKRVVVSPDEGGLYDLRITWKTALAKIEVFPLTPDTMEVSDIKITGQPKDTSIWLKCRTRKGKPSPKTLPLLIVYTDAQNERHGFFQSLDFIDLANPK